MTRQGDDDKTCAWCDGEMASGTLKTGNIAASIVIAGKPDAFLGVVPYTTSPVEVRVCLACGHIALFAKSLERLLQMGGGAANDL